jgi:hypothetical protein
MEVIPTINNKNCESVNLSGERAAEAAYRKVRVWCLAIDIRKMYNLY